MRLEKFKNAKRNSIWGIIFKIIVIIFPFTIRTIIIKKIGTDYLGLSSLFTSILNLLNLTELGVGTAIVYSMYEPLAKDDDEKICALMNLYKKIYRIIGLIVLIIGLIIIPFIKNLITGQVPNDINIYYLFLIYLANTVLSYWLFAYKTCILQIHQRVDISTKINIIVYILTYSLQIIILLSIKNYYLYILMLPLSTILYNILNGLYVDRRYKKYKPKGNVTNDEKKGIRKRVIGLMATKIAYTSRNALDSIVISSLLGLEMVAIYNNYFYIISALSAFFTIIATSISAGVGNSIVLESKEKNLEDLKIINFVYIFFSGICFSILITLYQPFMNIWVGDNLMLSNVVMITFGIYFLIEKSIDIIGQYFDATGLWWIGKWRGIIEAFANLVLNVIFCKLFGIMGVLLATIITILFIGLPLIAKYLFKNYFIQGKIKFLINQYIYIFVFIIIGILTYLICFKIPTGDNIYYKLIFLGVRFITSLIISFIMSICVLCKTKDFRASYIWIKKRILKK